VHTAPRQIGLASPRTWVARTASLLLVGAFLLFGVSTTPAFAAGPGRAVIVEPNSNTPLNGGGSQTPFTFELPVGAACPGDSAHKEYLIDSFVVPRTVNPSSLYFQGGAPRGATLLVDQFGNPYMANNTIENTGAIPTIPIFSWTAYTGHLDALSSGTYSVGLMCANKRGDATSNYWDTQVSFKADSADPGGFTWTAINQPKASGHSSSAGTIAGLSIAALVVGGVAFLFLSRRPRPASRPTA
jgi:hypothetical protein